MNRVLVFGGRDYANVSGVALTLNQLRGQIGDFCVIQGGAKGADKLAKEWALFNGLPVMEFPAPWDFYRNGAGHVRNGWMLSIGNPTHAVGFPGGRGTADMAQKCRHAGVWLWQPYP